MNALYMIRTIAVYEMKTLIRGWFFRIYAIAALLFFGFFDYFALASSQNMDWEMKAISGSMFYFNLLMLNSVQAVIAIFLASDFLKRDRKDDTTEVIYMRSITNLGYIAGKTIGILSVFMAVNVAILAIVTIYTLTISDLPFVWQPHLWYLVLISLPTLVFILGLASLTMSLVRNQAVTTVVLLGYVITSMIFLGNKFHNLLDYIGYHIPFTYSDFGGFADLEYLLVHRGAYLLLGVSFILFTSLLLKRLPQSRLSVAMTAILAITTLAGGVFLGYTFINNLDSATHFRAQMNEMANANWDLDTITPLKYKIDLDHLGEGIAVAATCYYTNENQDPLTEFVMNLNPGLVVDSVKDTSGELVFSRELQLIRIRRSKALATGDEDSLTIHYHGTIDERACYPDIDPDDRLDLHRPLDTFSSKGRFAWLTPDYVLLTPESNWYPIAGTGYASDHPVYHRTDFCQYQLNVKTTPDNMAISQGVITNSEAGLFEFSPEYRLPSVALTIGDFESRSVVVDSTEYNLYTLKGHDYFAPYFTDIGDTLDVLIRDARQDFENKVKLQYPFKRLNIIEVPIHFQTHRHIWSITQETVLPEIVLLPELGAPFYGTDFNRTKRRAERNAERENQELSDMEIQSKMFRRFSQRILLGDFSPFRSSDDGELEFLACYNLFPNLFTYVNHLQSEQWPVLNLALEAYYSRRLIDTDNFGTRFFEGMVPEERANMLLMEKSLAEILTELEDREYATLILEQKGEYLFKQMQKMFGAEEFEQFLNDLLVETRFSQLTLDKLLTGIDENFDVQFRSNIDSWYNTHDLPGFEIFDFKTCKVVDGNRERYQVRFLLENPESVPGLARVSFERTRDDHNTGNSDDENALTRRLVLLQPGQIIEQGFLLDYKPGSMAINTMVSRNLPLVFQQMCTDFELDKKVVPFDGERIVKERTNQNVGVEIIVDNEDDGFGFDKSPPSNLLRQHFARSENKEKYVGFRFWDHMETWEPTINAHYYGEYIRSSHFTNNSGGKRSAWWEAEMPTAGFYDIFFFVSRGSTPWWYDNDNEDSGEYQLRIHSADGIEETLLDMKSATDGWNYLGSYYLSDGLARVDLSNETTARYILADAVKWVLR